jgi:hypothetical protein
VTEPVTRNRSRHACRRRRRAAGALAVRNPVEALQQSLHDMEPCILIAAPVPVGHSLAKALAGRFTVVLASDPRRAAGLVSTARFHAIVTVDGVLPKLRAPHGVPVIVLPADGGVLRARRETAAALAARRRDEPRLAGELRMLAALSYAEYLDLACLRVTRQYLLGLMLHHGGNVTEAARTARLERESLHRLLRRHGVDAELFRPHDQSVR